MLYAVIMAGGAGTRFWPESRALRPKQLLNLVGGRTMIQSTVDRLAGLIPPERVLIVTNARLVEALGVQLPELPAGSILGEPCKRDTAPCIGLAALEVSRHDPAAIMAVMPADHVIGPEALFRQAIEFAAGLVEDVPGRIATFGIKPTYPAESFGYIERGEPQGKHPRGAPPVFAVKQFREKPRAELAAEYLASGNFYWNSGIFLWSARTILDALERHEPEMFVHLQRIAAARDRDDYADVLQREFSAIRGISIDYAVMERARDVVVVEAPFEWDDVGSWQAIGRLSAADTEGNAIQGKHLGLGTTGSIIRTSGDHLIVTLGLVDCIVVHTPDATLVANKHDEESIRKLVKLIGDRGWQDYL
jgi:mannose-1-phosphate guanylyltransferase